MLYLKTQDCKILSIPLPSTVPCSPTWEKKINNLKERSRFGVTKNSWNKGSVVWESTAFHRLGGLSPQPFPSSVVWVYSLSQALAEFDAPPAAGPALESVPVKFTNCGTWACLLNSFCLNSLIYSITSDNIYLMGYCNNKQNIYVYGI